VQFALRLVDMSVKLLEGQENSLVGKAFERENKKRIINTSLNCFSFLTLLETL